MQNKKKNSKYRKTNFLVNFDLNYKFNKKPSWTQIYFTAIKYLTLIYCLSGLIKQMLMKIQRTRDE